MWSRGIYPVNCHLLCHRYPCAARYRTKAVEALYAVPRDISRDALDVVPHEQHKEVCIEGENMWSFDRIVCCFRPKLLVISSVKAAKNQRRLKSIPATISIYPQWENKCRSSTYGTQESVHPDGLQSKADRKINVIVDRTHHDVDAITDNPRATPIVISLS